MGDYIVSQEVIGGDLADEVTERNLAFINELRAFEISGLVDLPQLVVVGDQSSGKSSVLQAITKLPFPVDDRMCTRFATEVSLHRSPSHGPTIMSLSIKIPDDIEQASSEAHMRRIREWESWNSHIAGRLDPQAFGSILNEASDVILGDNVDGNTLSDITLHISQTGPEEPNLTIVDLPGLVSVSHEAHLTALSLVNRYIRNPKCIVLAILQPGDPGTQEVYQMLERMPDKENRVIGVINKCDRKQEGTDNWIFEHIKNEERNRNHHYLAQGWFGLRNRIPTERGISNEERDRREAEFFKQGAWANLNQPTRLGVNHLRDALTKMLNELIAKSIPELIPEIRKKIEECKDALENLGPARGTKSEQLKSMMDLASKFSVLSTNALAGNYRKLDNQDAKIRKIYQDALEGLQKDMLEDWGFFDYAGDVEILVSLQESEWESNILELPSFGEIHHTIHINRGKEFPEQVNNPCVLEKLWENKTANWVEKATVLIEKFGESIGVAVSHFFKSKSIRVDEDLRNNAQCWVLERLPLVIDDAKNELHRMISDEAGAIWTLNSQRVSFITAQKTLRINKMAQELVNLSTDRQGSAQDAETRIKSWLENNGKIAAVFETHDYLASCYTIAMDRFIDNVGLQVVERHLLGPSSPLKIFTAQYVVEESERDENLLERVAGERPSKRAQREDWTRKKENLEKMLQVALNYRFLSN